MSLIWRNGVTKCRTFADPVKLWPTACPIQPIYSLHYSYLYFDNLTRFQTHATRNKGDYHVPSTFVFANIVLLCLCHMTRRQMTLNRICIYNRVLIEQVGILHWITTSNPTIIANTMTRCHGRVVDTYLGTYLVLLLEILK